MDEIHGVGALVKAPVQDNIIQIRNLDPQHFIIVIPPCLGKVVDREYNKMGLAWK